LPIFSGAKLSSVSAEIVYPDPIYWHDPTGEYSMPIISQPWNGKSDSVFWRGSSTGGGHNKTNWKGYHRHRFVEMTNQSQIQAAEDGTFVPATWDLPEKVYKLPSHDHFLSKFAGSFVDVGFTQLACYNLNSTNAPQCQYMEELFQTVSGSSFLSQFDHKYLPDIDGNGNSGRFRAFLMSNSLPIKATIWREWHDSRLVPWKHFVPMENEFKDFWGIMEYFLGREYITSRVENAHRFTRKVKPLRDPLARRIAIEGGEWARRVLRREDMQVYLFRLLLEFSWLVDDQRAC
jgi:hypothetical protein